MKYPGKFMKALRYTLLTSIFVLGLMTIIGTGGSDDNDDGYDNDNNYESIENDKNSSIVGSWTCREQYTSSYQGSSYSGSSNYDMEFYSNGTWKSNPYDTNCVYRGNWSLSGNSLTLRITSGSGAAHCSNIDTSPRNYNINIRNGQLEWSGTYTTDGSSVSTRTTCN